VRRAPDDIHGLTHFAIERMQDGTSLIRMCKNARPRLLFKSDVGIDRSLRLIDARAVVRTHGGSGKAMRTESQLCRVVWLTIAYPACPVPTYSVLCMTMIV
jgi:hypothetical protein